MITTQTRVTTAAIIWAIICLLAILLLNGCSTWSKPGATAADWNRDYYECEKEAAPVVDSTASFYMKRRCMNLKGWTD